MEIREYRGFQIQVYIKVNRISVEIYRKEKLIHTIRDSDKSGEHFKSLLMALEAAKEWIDKTYPKERFKYLGEV